jgi:hypothetical protein
MSDWNALVRERLDLTNPSPEEQEQIVSELASHLDDLFEEYRAHGLSESEAVTRAIHEVTDWRGLAQNIQRAKQEESMNPRTKQLWLPGLVNLTIAMVLLMLEIRTGVQPRVYNAQYAAMVLYFPWLAILPFCGALGAYLSRRAGGDRWARLATASFPAAAYLGCFILIFLVTRFGPDRFVSLSALGVVVSTWVVIPGAALLLGALPFFGPSNKMQSTTLS